MNVPSMTRGRFLRVARMSQSDLERRRSILFVSIGAICLHCFLFSA
jgi:hypothetical protein